MRTLYAEKKHFICLLLITENFAVFIIKTPFYAEDNQAKTNLDKYLSKKPLSDKNVLKMFD